MLSDGAITLFDDMTAADMVLLLGGLGTFLSTITGLFIQLRGLKEQNVIIQEQNEVIRKDVNSNMTDANNRIEKLHETIAQQTSDARDLDDERKQHPIDVNLKLIPPDEEKENGPGPGTE